ncbi:hypothetical protein PFLUV_G00187320 [Perca fluviatilis]|uniref:Uncharacterized protein n=1 Tax=Perca fluviatilis TaxID=8168 RepID=A0A6A5EGJ5_PERFL|nr:hypothetical protein PFLUV_G00187320 [Perca fluviatilis]
MLCPASCLPLLRELAQWRCLLGWHGHHGVGTASAPGLTANAGPHQKPQGSEVKGSRPVGRTKPLPGNQFRSLTSRGRLIAGSRAELTHSSHWNSAARL